MALEQTNNNFNIKTREVRHGPRMAPASAQTSETRRPGSGAARLDIGKLAAPTALLTCLASFKLNLAAVVAIVFLLHLCPLPDDDFRLIPSANAFFIDSRQSPSTHEWSYEHQLSWPRQYKTCHMKAQSPIDIQHKNVITNHQLRLNFYNYNRPTKFKLQNAHHTIKMDPLGWAYQRSLEATASGQSEAKSLADQSGGNASAVHDDLTTADEYVEYTPSGPSNDNSNSNNEKLSKLLGLGSDNDARRVTSGASAAQQSNDFENDQSLPYQGAPTIKLDWLDDGNNEYKLRDIHFHWGERRDNGSEHAIDGRRAAMEMHLVHIKHGLDKSKIGFTSDSVAVIAVLIESHRKSNADFNPIVNVLSRINTTDEPQEIDYKSINDLLPSNLNSFYTYSGSLTTPPCYQVVNWIVMTERLNMNAKQIEMFRNIYSPPAADVFGHHPNLANNDDHHEQTAHHGPQLMVPNVRLLQPLNNRTILASFFKMGVGRLDSQLYSSSSASILSEIASRLGSTIYILTYVFTSLTFISAAISTVIKQHAPRGRQSVRESLD